MAYIFKKSLTLLLISQIVQLNVCAQQFHNLDFQQTCDSSETGLCHWELSWGNKKSVYPERTEGKQTLVIAGKDEQSVGFVEQQLQLTTNPEITILTISSLIKSETISGKGAGLNIGIYNDAGNLIATRDMGGFYSISWITGTTDWKEHSISIVCPKEAHTIKIGMILFGKGKAWFSGFKVTNTAINDRKPGTLAQKYIGDACKIIAENSLVRDSINLPELRETALKIAGNAKKYSDCFLAVSFLLESLRPLGDHHSFFMSAEEMKNWENDGSKVVQIEYPVCTVRDNCGYLFVPPFHGGNPKLIQAYADSLQRGIEVLSKTNIKGWIVDLRQNTGGNMEPMIAGLGPLFSAEKLGSLIDVNGKQSAWYYKNGTYSGDGYKGWKVTHPFTLKTSLPIAVLTGNQTGSSGEIVAISFIGNAKTRSFGQPTWGLTTGNSGFDLRDGSQLFLASTVMSDRNGKAYTSSVAPDSFTEDLPDTENDETIDAAVKWICEME